MVVMDCSMAARPNELVKMPDARCPAPIRYYGEYRGSILMWVKNGPEVKRGLGSGQEREAAWRRY
jgi:hypothetical protein